MADAKVTEYAVSLEGIRTDQFALLPDAFSEGADVQSFVQLVGSCDPVAKLLGMTSRCVFEQDGKTFLVVEATCLFSIDEDTWRSMEQQSPKKLTMPTGIALHLGTVSVGVLRGVLHAKTEGTDFNHFRVGLVNLTEVITEDFVFDIGGAEA